MIRRLLSVVCVICILLMVCVTVVPASAETNVIRPRKIVSVVYDDSSSMFGERWVYANYATQALIALLDESDELYITYMSDPHNYHKKSLKKIENVVNDMRNWSNSSGTPGESLDTAKNALDAINEKDSSVQFWLVVMTDGIISFNEDTTLQKKLDLFKGDKMSNGSSLNVVYLRMGANANKDVKADEKSGLYAYYPDKDSDIGPAIFSMASLISGRLDIDNLKLVDDKTITFSSKLPMYSISILSHQSGAKIESVTVGETKLNIDRNIALFAKDHTNTVNLEQYGNAGVASKKNTAGQNQVIQSGLCTVTFSEKVDLEDLLVQYEPAIGLKMRLYKDGNPVDVPSKLSQKDKVNVQLEPVISGTDTIIPIEDFPSGVKWSIEYLVDGNIVDSVAGQELNSVEIIKGENTFRGYMQLPGYSPLVTEIIFDINQIVYQFGIEVDQPSPLSYLRKDLSKGSEQGGSVTFYITNEGERLSAEDIKMLELDINVTDINCDDSNIIGFWDKFGKLKVNCSIEQNEDGSFTLIPKKYVPFTAFLILAGDYTVDVALSTDNTITSQGSFSVVPLKSDWYDLPKLIISLLLLAYILHLIFKPKFPKRTVNYESYKLTSDGEGICQNSFNYKKLKFSTGLFAINRASRCNFNGLELVAEHGGIVLVTDKSIAKNVYAYGSDNANPEHRLSRIVRNLSVVQTLPNGERIATDLDLTSTNEQQRLYFRNNEKDINIWCIWLS